MLQGTQIEDAMIAAKCRSNRRCPSVSSRRRGGLVTLKDSGWVLSLSIFHQPEIIGQPPGTSVWWGYRLYPERNGDFVRKRMDQCTGAEILEETLRHLRFDRHLAAIMASSICVPCNMPYVNNIWLASTHSSQMNDGG